MRFDEDALRERNPWKTVSGAPDLPFRSFAEFQAAVAKGSYVLDVSYIAARELAPYVRSVGGRLLNILLTVAPLVVIVAAIAAGLLSARYLLFLGVPVAVIGHFLGNPLNPLRAPMTALNAALVVALLITVLMSYAIPAALMAAFVLPFFANRAMYASNVRALRAALVKSEALFLNQYSKGGLRLRRSGTTPMEPGDPQ